MARETRSSKRVGQNPSSEHHKADEIVFWKPKDFQIQRVRNSFVNSNRVSVHAIPEGANIFTGKNIPENALVVSSHHLRFLKFPLHPIFQILWRVTGLHPMQFNPISYMLLCGLLVMGMKWEVSLGLGDFFYFHRCGRIFEKALFFHFSPRPQRKVFEEKMGNVTGWKNEPLMVLGEWAAPELSMDVPKVFSKEIEYKPCSMDSVLDESRMTWLKEHVLRRGWNAALFCSSADLEDISNCRSGPIYCSCLQLLEPNLRGERLFNRVVELESNFLTSERTPTLFAESLKVGDSFEEPENLEEDDMDINRIKVPNPQGKKSKKQKLSQAESEITHRSEGGLELPHTPQIQPSPCKSSPGSLVASSSNTTFQGSGNMSLPPLKAPLQLTFRKEDDSYVLEGDPIAFDKEACLAVAQALALNPVDHERLMGLSQRDLAAQVALSLQSASSMTQHLLMRTEAAEDRLWSLIHKAKQETQKVADDLKVLGEVVAKKSKEVEDRNKKIDELNAKLSKETTNRAKEFELNQSQVTKCSCKSFRLGWVQGQQKEEDRVFEGPDAFDEEMGLKSSDYEWIHGMRPEDKPSSDDANEA
ncbi:hypothetical protein RchiOBHm_Chr6g0254061 [Rosa chinensis]|uniref:Uncharacterized protein n=1 Tax=Rosa chinensis TaxID=74649 RepID=A0A2P6PLJ8_ROSCH|nr:uncharacterized protein LOC112174312 [Rosa chinensis]PRQ22786.1 hypothetical protein RchiOBHm_Chr6g0254061 [Rosa chinensis]